MMRRHVLHFFLLVAGLLPAFDARAQYSWQPLNIIPAQSRYDDMYWRSPQLGWTIDFSGFVRRTTDGGQTWQTLLGPPGRDYRSIGFLTDSIGFIGKLVPARMGADTAVLYRTTDAGLTWAPVQLPGRVTNKGFCGMSAVNDSVLMACGRYSGNATFYRTTDAGLTWQVRDMRGLAGGLVDCHFWSPDSGIVVGTNGAHRTANGLVLFTADGGQTWSVKHTTANVGDLCWKITFPSKRVGYVSIEDFNGGNLYCLKTTDQGQTWREVRYGSALSFNAEGIGFINDSVGWIGGDYVGPTVYRTVDGGQTWTATQLAPNLNRFRFFGDTLGYASGTLIYRITPQAVGLPEKAGEDGIGECWPNPAADRFALPLTLRRAGLVRLALTDVLGREVLSRQARYPAGAHELEVSLTGLPPGLYSCHVQSPAGRRVRTLVVQR